MYCFICQKQTHKTVRKTYKLVCSQNVRHLNAARIAGVQNEFQRFTDDDLANKNSPSFTDLIRKLHELRLIVATDHNKAFLILVEEINIRRFNQRHGVFNAAELINIYKSFLPNENKSYITCWRSS